MWIGGRCLPPRGHVPSAGVALLRAHGGRVSRSHSMVTLQQSCSGPRGFRSSVGDPFVFPVWMQAELSFSLKTTFSSGAAKPRHPSRPFAWHPGRPSTGTCGRVFSRDGCLHALLSRWCQCRRLESFSERAVIRRWKRGVGVSPAVEPPSYWLCTSSSSLSVLVWLFPLRLPVTLPHRLAHPDFAISIWRTAGPQVGPVPHTVRPVTLCLCCSLFKSHVLVLVSLLV